MRVQADTLSKSAASYHEMGIVLDRFRNPVVSARPDTVIEDVGIIVEPVTVEQAKVAREAYRNYGKGSGHRAKLNFGDCLSYARARVKREPILYKGDDFEHTDLGSALQEP
jgi:ribonuclease VapC